jgi:peptidoglycan/xylan/chitin deacetylase (PgdA/CDA1 family)
VNRFAEQLDLLGEGFDIVPLGTLLDLEPGSHPRIAITIDDAYAGALECGLPELVRRRLPATVFVTPAFLGGHSFWWDAIAGPDGLPDDLRSYALETLRGDDAAIREWARESGRSLTEPPAHGRCASEEELKRAAALPGITLGSHTWSHPNLAVLEAARLTEEVTRPLAWLRERFEGVVPWLSYPYGRWSPAVAAAARGAGYRAAVRVEGGWYRRGAGGDYGLPRLNVPAGISGDGFSLRLAGLFCR